MNRTKISDFLTGKNVWEHYILYNETQWYSKSQMEVLQLEKLKKLLIHCKENVPFYSAVMHQKNIDPTKIDSIQILDEFPIVTKEIIKDNYNDFIPKNLKTIAGVKISQTGGTTGNILFKRTDANVRSSTWATYKRFQDWHECIKQKQEG